MEIENSKIIKITLDEGEMSGFLAWKKENKVKIEKQSISTSLLLCWMHQDLKIINLKEEIKRKNTEINRLWILIDKT